MSARNDTERRIGKLTPIILLACTVIVISWELASHRSSRPWEPFGLTAEDFAGFTPQSDEWTAKAVAVDTNNPAEPNILAYELRRRRSGKGQEALRLRSGQARGKGTANAQRPTSAPRAHPPAADNIQRPSSSKGEDQATEHRTLLALRSSERSVVGNTEHFRAPVLARLVHGYNMPACMKLKGYAVALLRDGMVDGSWLMVDGEQHKSTNESVVRIQLWLLTSKVGDKQIWVTSMIRATDFGVEDMDVRDIAFPRVAAGDDLTWESQGIRLKSFRHPIRNLRKYLARKWSNARCDLLVFLRLKQPPWASRRLLTVVSAVHVPRDAPDEEAVTELVSASHSFFYDQLCGWKQVQSEQDTSGIK